MLNFSKRNLLLIKTLHDLLDNLFNFMDFFQRSNHRIHDSQISKRAGAVNGAKLRFKHFTPLQADTNSSVSHCRIFFVRQIHVFRLLICSDIQCTDNHKLLPHNGSNFSIGAEKFRLSRIVFSAQILKLTSQKTDTGGPHLLYASNVF